MKTMFITVASILALSVPAQAQETQNANEPVTAENSQCLHDMQQLAQRMEDEGYWLAGYPGARTGGYGTRYPYGPTGGAVAPSATADADTATDPAVDQPVAPWADVGWRERPQYEIGTLFRAANVLASNGNEQACQAVVQATEERYAELVGELRELGVDPEQVSAWRQSEIAAAEPVEETGYPRRVEDVIGADIRNVQDDDLGEIEDVVLNAEEGNIRYVVVSTGGFFDIGDKDVLVPWEHLRVTPRGSFVLPVEQQAMEDAPRAAGEDVDPQRTGSIDESEIDSYWGDALGEDAGN